jgi:hypothetical protein
MRAMALQYPDDLAGWTLYDQYSLGPGLLVAPVMVQGATARSVHLPPGRWYPLGGGAALNGSQDVTVQAPLTEIPLFAPAGAIIPLLPDGVQTVLPAGPGVVTLERMSGQREVWVFAGAPGAFTERDGTAYSLQASASTAGFAEGGTPLYPCAAPGQRGCVDVSLNPPSVRLVDGGPLSFGDSTLTIRGPPRVIDVRVSQ